MEQSEIVKIIKKLDKLENSKGVDVEDILKLLKKGDKSLVPPLKELSLKFKWKGINDDLFVPLSTWVDTICIYFEYGFSGLQVLLSKKDRTSEFALATLEEIKTIQSLEVILSVAHKLNYVKEEIEFIEKYVYTLNQISFKVEKQNIDESIYSLLMNTLKKIIAFSETIDNESVRASSVLCIGRLGRLQEVDFLKSLKSFQYPYIGIESKVIKNIKRVN